MKLVSTVHGWGVLNGRMPLYNRLDRWCLPRYDKVICVSTDLFDECLEAGVRPDRLELVENAIDDTQFCPSDGDRSHLREGVGLPMNSFVIGAVGRLSREKGLHFLLPAIAQIRSDGTDVLLAIAGEGPERKALENQVRELGIEDSVTFLGFQEDTSRFFQALDSYCLSSTSEGLPNVLLEAMSCGIPTVATDLPGVRQVIRDPDTQGLIVAPSDSDALYGALRQLIDSKEQRETLSRNGRQRILDGFSFSKRMERVAGIYQSLGIGT
jgi:glycosyltransferase involved in cell wall biosynthesis